MARELRMYKMADYDSRMGNHSYCYYTTGTDYMAVYDGKEYPVAIRSGKTPYLEKPAIEPRDKWQEVSLEDVEEMVLADVAKHFNIPPYVKPERAKAIEEELKLVKVGTDNLRPYPVYTLNQVELIFKGYTGIEPIKVSYDDYYAESREDYPNDSNCLYSEITYSHYDRGWNAGTYYSHTILIPWEKTKWGSKQAYDAAYHIPEKADFTKPVEIGSEIFENLSTYISRIESISRNMRCWGKVVVTSDGKLKAIDIDYKHLANYSEFSFKVAEYNSFEEFEEAMKAEISAKEKEQLEEATKRKEFARMCGRKARKYGIAFTVALAFKGDDEALTRFADSMKSVISKRLAYDSHELECGRARNRAEMERLGIAVDGVDTNRINDYVLRCLEAGKLLLS